MGKAVDSEVDNVICTEYEVMRHVYYWNTEKEEKEYDMMFTDHISQQKIT
jgi:hypothetical protein